jgi:hypothetical protein
MQKIVEDFDFEQEYIKEEVSKAAMPEQKDQKTSLYSS